MDISGQQRKRLTDALICALPRKSSLEQMLSFELNKKLDAIAGGDDLREVIFKLIEIAEAENWIDSLIFAARKSNPGNSLLKAIAEELLANDRREVDTDTYQHLQTDSLITVITTEESNLKPLETGNECVSAVYYKGMYIERPPIEEKCFAAIAQPGALIRIKAAQKMGKTLLLEKLLERGRQQDYQTAKLDLKLADKSTLNDLKTFLRWLCVDVSDNLELEPQLDKYWKDFYGLNKNCTRYFQKYLLSGSEHPLILAIDNFERLFAYPEIFPQFCLLLRSWYESAKSGDRIGTIWKKLRLVVVHSTEKYPELDTNHSPFNVGTTIDLPEFNLQQVEALAKKYKLDGCLGQKGLSELMMKTLGGHPYLVHKAIDYLKSQPNFSGDGETQRGQQATIEELLQLAPTEQGIFSDHLREQLWNLQHNPQLELGYKKVVSANKAVRLDAEVGFKLHSLGLVKLLGNDCVPSCDLYRQYFSERLE